MLKKFQINHIPEPCSIVNVSNLSTVPFAAASPSLMKRNLSVEYSNESVRNMKKLRENLIQKHTPISVGSLDPITDEIESYLKLDINCEDVLRFWQSSDDAFPHLRKLAETILAIPATSTPSE